MKLQYSLLFIFYILINSSQLAEAQEKPDYIEVSYNLYLITNISGGNVTFLVTKKGIVVVDAGGTPANGKKIVSIIKSVSNKPIKYLILTHFHNDHINGISSFPKDVQIIAHKNLGDNYRQYSADKLNNYIEKVLPGYLTNLKLEMGLLENKESEDFLALKKDFEMHQKYYDDIININFRKPDIAFEDFYRFRISDERIVVEYPGPGHTSDNIIVKFSNHNVIHMGDLVFNKSFPYTIEEHGVDIYNWVQTLDDLKNENIYTVIPGHGEIGDKVILQEQSGYFKSLAQKVERLKNQGFTLEQIIENMDVADYDFSGDENQFPENIKVIYNQLVNSKINWWKF